MNPLTKIDDQIFNALKQALGGEFLQQLVETFCDDSNQQLELMQNALEQGNAADFTRAAHTLKSTSLTFGASAFGGLARKLEMMGREGKIEKAQEKYQDLNDACKELQIILKDLSHAQYPKE